MENIKQRKRRLQNAMATVIITNSKSIKENLKLGLNPIFIKNEMGQEDLIFDLDSQQTLQFKNENIYTKEWLINKIKNELLKL